MTTTVPRFVLQQQALGRRSGHFQAVSLFADISGFTELTKALSRYRREGAATLATALRYYFAPLVTAVHQAGGFFSGFAGVTRHPFRSRSKILWSHPGCFSWRPLPPLRIRSGHSFGVTGDKHAFPHPTVNNVDGFPARGQSR